MLRAYLVLSEAAAKAISKKPSPERVPLLGRSRELWETSLAFLVHPTLNKADIEDTCRAVQKAMFAASAEA